MSTDTTTPESTTETLTPEIMATVIDTYLEAYGEADPTKRIALVRQAWSVDGRLQDPPLEADGHDGIAALTDVLHAHFAGHTFRRTSGVDAHHGMARYGWELVGPDGAVALAGMDVAEFTADGKLAKVTGFFGDVPAV
ncbi:unnamed protein product [Phaeothamnion confervicola]